MFVQLLGGSRARSNRSSQRSFDLHQDTISDSVRGSPHTVDLQVPRERRLSLHCRPNSSQRNHPVPTWLNTHSQFRAPHNRPFITRALSSPAATSTPAAIGLGPGRSCGSRLKRRRPRRQQPGHATSNLSSSKELAQHMAPGSKAPLAGGRLPAPAPTSYFGVVLRESDLAICS